MAAYFAVDNILHNGQRYEPGDELSGEDFTAQQIEQLYVAGVIRVRKELSVAEAGAGNEADKLSSLLDAVAAANLELTVASADPITEKTDTAKTDSVADKSGEDAADAVTAKPDAGAGAAAKVGSSLKK